MQRRHQVEMEGLQLDRNIFEAKNTALVILGFLFLVIFLGIGYLPEVVIIPPHSWDQSENWISQFHRTFIILPDDMMITMRVAKFFLLHGYPGFNVSDLSQPATSYILPIVMAPLFYLLPDNIALALVSLLGALAFSACGILLVKAIQTKLQFALLLILFFNSTTLAFLFSGWEHLWQCFFVILAYAAAYDLNGKNDHLVSYIAIGIASALAVLFRVDSIFLVAPLLVWILLSGKSGNAYMAILTFILVGVLYSYFQLKWFGTLIPTTARLKASSLPGMKYSVVYLYQCIIKGGAIAFIPLLVLIFRNSFIDRKSPGLAALTGISLSCSYAILVSDVFPFGRMFLAPLVLTLLVCSRAISHNCRDDGIGSSYLLRYKTLWAMVCIVLCLPIIDRTLKQLGNRIEHPFSPSLTSGISSTAEQMMLSRYIIRHLKPSDGSVGLFSLGTASFYMIEYSVADFLGKADETIAKLPVKWGPPGHNKWNTEISLSKWNPAVIPFAEVDALRKIEASEKLIRDHADYSFSADFDLALKRRGYIFCMPYPNFVQGLYVRKDLMLKFTSCEIVKANSEEGESTPDQRQIF
jgi:hypothetical protein